MAGSREVRKFDRPVLIEQKERVWPPSGSGDAEFAWVEYARGFARREVLSSEEMFQARQFEAHVSAMYRLRHRIEGIEHHMRLTDLTDNRSYDITGIRHQERQEGGPILDCFEHAE